MKILENFFVSQLEINRITNFVIWLSATFKFDYGTLSNAGLNDGHGQRLESANTGYVHACTVG